MSKPAKYELLYCSLCDGSVPYTYYSLPYAGKPDVMTKSISIMLRELTITQNIWRMASANPTKSKVVTSPWTGILVQCL